MEIESKRGAVETPVVDFIFADHFSVAFLHPQTEAARVWVEENIGEDSGYQPQWPSVLIEPRYAGDILHGLRAVGLSVRV